MDRKRKSSYKTTMATIFRSSGYATLTVEGTYSEIKRVAESIPSGIDVKFVLKLSIKKAGSTYEREEYTMPLVNYNDGRDSLKILDMLHKQGRVTVDEHNDILSAIQDLKSKMSPNSVIKKGDYIPN